ncbi:hypothetical protein ACQPX6_11680 [Actinomycetospora sp. CA-101289]|uniref:hypothetical protein n=1 Tax=Actinomycetospora sp. CA-101289 TaxID=3239893 RepID=UPI003D95289C
MSYAAPTARETARRRSSLRAAASVVTTGLCVGVMLVLLETAVTEPETRRGGSGSAPGVVDLPYGGQLDRPDPGDVIEPGGLMGLGLLTLGLLNGLVFAGAAGLDGVRGPSAAETRRRLRARSARGAVPGGRREVARTVATPAAAPAASDGPAVVDVPARRSAPGRPALGTTYAVIPSPRAPEPDRRPDPEPPVPEQRTPEPAPEQPAPAEPTRAPSPRRPSPVPRDGGDGAPIPATRRGTGPWGWRPARPDPVPWRNPLPAMAGAS